MTARYISIFVCATALVQSGFSQSLLESVQRLTQFEKSSEGLDHKAYFEATNQALAAWEKASDDEKSRFSPRMFLVHFRRAQIMASSNNFKEAASELIAEAAMQKEFEGRLEFATKSPDAFFRDLVELQAQLTAETGSDPLANKVGYSFEKEGDDFTAARLELGDDAGGITVPEMTSEEALALVHRVSRQGGRFVASAPKWFVVPKGRLPDVLKLAKREVTFDSTGKMTVHALQAGSGTAPTATNSDNATAAPQVPPMVQPATPKKATEAKPASTPSEEPASSTPWLVWAVLIIAAISLLWLLVRKRK
jgi:hypothetical protein